MTGSGWILESEPGDHRTDGKWGVRERGVKDGSQVSGQVTGRKGLAKNRGGAGVGVNGNGEFSFGLGGLRHLFDTLSRQAADIQVWSWREEFGSHWHRDDI